ncbi:MAG: OmpA family protein [Flavobacteriaceae bacterium]
MKILKNIFIVIIAFQFLSFAPINDTVKVFKKNNETYFYLSQKINFSLNKITIEEGWKPQLFLLIQALKKNSTLKIEIGVHNDLRSRNDLSQTRADVLKSFIINYGVKDENVITKGYGASQPVINCLDKQIKCTERNQNSNRRVELKIINPNVLENVLVINNDQTNFISSN